MATRTGFDLDADVTLSELRHEDVLDARLREHGFLRLRRRNEVLAVLVEPSEWRSMQQHVAQLEAELDRHEDDAVRALIAARAPHAKFERATDDVIADIQRQYEELMNE